MAGRRLPLWVRSFNPIAKVLLAVGIPMGPEVLLTVRGRKTGLPRSTPVAVAQIAGKWWLIGPFGEGDWVRNLRAAGRATLTTRRASEEITATELGRAEKLTFFGEILGPAAEREFVFEVHRPSREARPASGRPR